MHSCPGCRQKLLTPILSHKADASQSSHSTVQSHHLNVYMSPICWDVVLLTWDNIPLKPTFPFPQYLNFTLSTQRDLCCSYSHSKWNQYLERGICIPNITVCPKQGQFMWAENKDTESTPIPLKKTHNRRKGLREKNRWQMRPNSIAVTMKPDLRGQISWAGESMVRLQRTSRPLPSSMGFDGSGGIG